MAGPFRVKKIVAEPDAEVSMVFVLTITLETARTY